MARRVTVGEVGPPATAVGSRTSATLLVNPAAGQGRYVRRGRATWRLERVIGLLGTRYDLHWELTQGPGEAADQARAAALGGTRVVFGLGGDGTLRECAQGLLGTGVPLGLLPGGTANVLAPSLGLPASALEAAEGFAEGDPADKVAARPVDIGLCGEVPFLMCMSRGLDGRALAAVPPAQKRRLGKVAVVLGGLTEFARRSEVPFRIRWREDGLCEQSLEASYVAVCNVPHYAGRLRMAPQATPFDRHLDVVALSRNGRWATLRFIGGLVAGRTAAVAGVRTARVRELWIEGEGEQLVQVDGDPLRRPHPLAVRIAPERLLLAMPGRRRSP